MVVLALYPFERKAFVLDDESVHEALDVRLNRRVMIDGRLRGVESFRDFRIKFVNEEGRASEQARIGSDGRFQTSDLGPGKWFPLIGKGPWDRYLPRDGGRFEITPGASNQTIDWELTKASSLSFLPDEKTPRTAPISIRITDSEGSVVYEIRNGKLLPGIPLLPGTYGYDWSDEQGKGTGSVIMRAGSGMIVPLR